MNEVCGSSYPQMPEGIFFSSSPHFVLFYQAPFNHISPLALTHHQFGLYSLYSFHEDYLDWLFFFSNPALYVCTYAFYLPSLSALSSLCPSSLFPFDHLLVSCACCPFVYLSSRASLLYLLTAQTVLLLIVQDSLYSCHSFPLPFLLPFYFSTSTFCTTPSDRAAFPVVDLLRDPWACSCLDKTPGRLPCQQLLWAFAFARKAYYSDWGHLQFIALATANCSTLMPVALVKRGPLPPRITLCIIYVRKHCGPLSTMHLLNVP